MASIPKKVCLACRIAKKTNENIKKNIKIYVFLGIMILEFLSIKFQNYVTQDYYAYKLYPLLSTIELFLITLFVFYHSEKLRFCVRQKLIILFLLIYFFINITFIIIPVCWSGYYNLVNYGILSVLTILFIATWKNL